MGFSLMKPVLGRTVKVIQILVLLIVLVSAGLLIAEKGTGQRYRLLEKKAFLERENRHLAEEIKTLERKVTLLRSDPGTIEKAAKSKLGMARREETVYIFVPGHNIAGVVGLDNSLSNGDNKP